ncbi:MAG: translational GTPase TypA [Deinococcus sp.]|nr:translational GTPase TypA [Deinococcus sp.]
MGQTAQEFRNIAIIAHVDHGKTTLLDAMLRQTGTFRENQVVQERVMDSGELERERGITILAKNTAVSYRGVKINIVDTPGHADFGGEVERTLGMVDGALLLVDASEGPMPQTRFVLRKALAQGLRPILVINKMDRSDARPDPVLNEVFDLFAELGATNEQLDFPVVYAKARAGISWRRQEEPQGGLKSLFDLILEHVPPPERDLDAPFQMRLASLDYSDYLGRIAIGRIHRGRVRRHNTVVLLGRDGSIRTYKVTAVFTHLGLTRQEVELAEAGDIVALAGIEAAEIGDTLADPQHPNRLPPIVVEEPTVTVTFLPNNSPFSGREGRFVTSRHLRERLLKELQRNVSLRVQELSPDEFKVSGRGELHLSVLMETMRREGFEFQVSRPQVITKEEAGKLLEPAEHLVVDIPERFVGAVMEALGRRKGGLRDLRTGADGRARLEFRIPSRSLMGWRTSFLSFTSGEGIMHHVFDGYMPWAGELASRTTGSLVSMEEGETFTYALWKLQDRGTFFITPGTPAYVGMIVGEHNRSNDLNVNVCKNKKFTNIRSHASDEAMSLIPHRQLTLEDALGYIRDDELLEVTPQSLRLRKRTTAAAPR